MNAGDKVTHVKIGRKGKIIRVAEGEMYLVSWEVSGIEKWTQWMRADEIRPVPDQLEFCSACVHRSDTLAHREGCPFA